MVKSNLPSRNRNRSSAPVRAAATTRGPRHNRHMTQILTARQERVLLLRFAQGAAAPPEKVAEAMGVSREVVRRLERDALRRLRLDALNPTVKWGGWDEV